MDGVILGIENPIMDISAGVDEALMKKYGLQAGNAILVEDGDEKMKLFDELTAKPDVAESGRPGRAQLLAKRHAYWASTVVFSN